MAIFNSGVRGKRAKDNSGVIGSQSQFVQQQFPQISITSYSISGVDDTALNPTGGQTVVVSGGGFASGMTGTLGGSAISAITVVSPTKATFTAPAKSAGSYTLMFSNTNNTAAILVPGITYSSVPTFTTAAGSIGTVYETKPISTSVTATSDSALTYALTSGALPAGSALSSSGVITGTAPVDNASTTYNFSITATDAELQDVTRSFTLTVNTDVVTWVNPSNSATLNVEATAFSSTLNATSAAGYSISSYTANALPSGLTLSNGVISGTPDTEQTITTLLTATSATSNRSTTNTITWIVSLSDINWKYNSVLLSASSAMVDSLNFVSDSSLNTNQLSVSGDAYGHNFHPYQHGFYSVNFPAASNYMTGSHSWLNVSNQLRAWTFECWINPQIAGCIFAIGSGGPYGNSIYIDWGTTTANKFNISQSNGSSAAVNFGTTNTYPAGKWYHLAITRTTGGVCTIYVNGVADGTNTYTAGTFATGTTFVVNGSYDNNGLGANGSAKVISNLRFVVDRVVYSGAFTPSTTPLIAVQGTLLLLCQSNRFIDTCFGHAVTVSGTSINISSAHPFSSKVVPSVPSSAYSYYFNGSSYLTITSTATLLLGMTWTVEAWIYPTSSGKQHIFNVGGTYCYVESVSGFNLSKWSNGSNSGNYGGYLVLNAWNHVVWQCNTDGIVRGFINGIIAIQSSGYAINTQTDACVGSGAGLYNYSGYICNLRVLKGTALYNTAGFQVPAAPLTAITDTVLLTGQSSTIVDNSTNNFTLTQTGTVTSTPFGPTQYNVTSYTSSVVPSTYGSAYFDGTGDYVSAPAAVVNSLTGTWTVEAWCYMTQAPTGNTYATSFPILTVEDGAGTISHYWGVGSTAFVCMYRDSSSYDTITGTMPSINQWFHIAVTNVGSTVTFYINGIQAGTKTQTAGTWNSTQSVVRANIGALYTYAYAKGYISNLRIVNGTAIYTNTFVPSTLPLTATTNTSLLTLQYNGSHNNSTVKDQSNFNNVIARTGNVSNGTFSPYGNTFGVYYPVSAFTTLASSPITFGANANFTVEGWVNMSSFTGSGYYYLMFGSCDQSSLLYWSCGIEPSGKATVQWYDGNSKVATSSTSLILNTWYHIAYVATAGVVKIYINGVSDTLTGTTTLTNPTGNASYTTGAERGNHSGSGYFSNIRLTASALYSANFIPSTTPLTASNSTGALFAQSNRFIDVSYNNYTVTANNSATITTKSPFNTIVTSNNYYSGYFNGSTDYLTIGSSAINLPTSTTPFTLEAWVYITAYTGISIISSNYSTGNGIPFMLGINSGTNNTTIAGGYPILYYYSGGTWTYAVQSTSVNSTPLSLNTWYHVAGVYDGTSAKIFVNGVNTVSNSISSWQTTASASALGILVGRKWDTSGVSYFSGYISNARLVIGTAVYTTAFTPSTTPLTAITNTTFLTCKDNTFNDNSTNNYTITSAGTAKPAQVSPFASAITTTTENYNTTKFGGSMYFDGTSDYLTIPASTTLALGSGDFSVDAWVYTTIANQTYGSGIIGTYDGASNGGWSLAINRNSGGTYGIVFIHANAIQQSYLTYLTINTWHHVAVTRIGTTLKTYLNGIQVATGTYSTADTVSAICYIGSQGVGQYHAGYISDVRVCKGVSAITANFLPGTTPAIPTNTTALLVSGSAGSIIDSTRLTNFETMGDALVVNSVSPYSGSYYSNYFDGTGDYITSASSASLALESSDFTVELWYKATGRVQNYPYLIGNGAFGSGYWQICDRHQNANTKIMANVGSASASAGWLVSTTTVVEGSWYHVALVRSGSTFKLYVNGVAEATNTFAGSITSASNSITIGMDGSQGISAYTGYISNVRIVKGTAVYTSTFTPSTTPLTAISGTNLLTCQSNRFTDNSTNNFTLTASGDTKVKSQNPFQINSGQSYYFDGTGDMVATGPSTHLDLTGDFTIELWLYPLSTGGFILNRGGGLNVAWASYELLINGTDIWFAASSANTSYDIGGESSTGKIGSVVAGTWNHLAVTRSGNVYRGFVNGVQGYTQTLALTPYTASTRGLNLGASYQTTWGVPANIYQLLTGYISDLRITKGVARYTSAFTPPVAPLKLK